MSVERADAKHTTLFIEKYDGSARLGELVIDINKDPRYPSLYIGNIDQNNRLGNGYNHNLNYLTTPISGLYPGGNAILPNAGVNTNFVGGLFLGDLKQSLLNADHSGWVKLDGRAVSTLPPSQQLSATALGYPTNLPNVTGRILKQTTSPTGTTGGNTTTTTLVEQNIPYMTGDFYTNNLYDKEVIAAVVDPNPNVSPPNLVSTGPRGPYLTTVTGQISIGTLNPDPITVPEQPNMSVNTFVFLGP